MVGGQSVPGQVQFGLQGGVCSWPASLCMGSTLHAEVQIDDPVVMQGGSGGETKGEGCFQKRCA